MSKGSKTRKTALQRFKITGKGRLMRKHATTSHLRSKESVGRSNRKKGTVEINERFEKTVKRMLQL
ncbi:MAG: 50S ribosomal protein L35 [bacterium]